MSPTPWWVWCVCYLTMAVGFGGLASYVAYERRRSELEGFFLGFVFGPLGVIVIGLLPVNEVRPVKWFDPPGPTPVEPTVYRKNPR